MGTLTRAQAYRIHLDRAIKYMKLAVTYAEDGAPQAAAGCLTEAVPALKEAVDLKKSVLGETLPSLAQRLAASIGDITRTEISRAPVPEVVFPKKRQLSAEGRASISRAQKRRWAAKRKAAK